MTARFFLPPPPAAMKLDVNVLRHLTRDDFRTLTAVEQGQKKVRGRDGGGESRRMRRVGRERAPVSGRGRARH